MASSSCIYTRDIKNGWLPIISLSWLGNKAKLSAAVPYSSSLGGIGEFILEERYADTSDIPKDILQTTWIWRWTIDHTKYWRGQERFGGWQYVRYN